MSDIIYHGVSIGRIAFDRSVTISGALDGEPFDVAIPCARLILSDAIKALIDGQAPATPELPTDPIPPKGPDQPPDPGDGGEPSAPPDPPVDPKPPQDLPPPPPPAHDDGPHTVTMTVVDKDHTWSATGHVGDDPGVAAVYVPFIEPTTGKTHPGLTAWFYADGVEAGATRFDNAFDFINIRSIAVTYDGAVVAVPASSKPDGTFDFWRGCRSPMIRYGAQVAWSASRIDWTLLPAWAKGKQQPYSDAKCDYTFNGLGNASTPAMGQGGSRPELGYLTLTDLAFVTDPNDSTWATVRRTGDHDSVWPVFWSDPVTGRIVDWTKYPGFTVSPQAQVRAWKNNPLAPYGGAYDGDTLDTKGRTQGQLDASITGCAFVPDAAHLTGYGLLAAMVTHTARDRDHASFWANWPIIEVAPFTKSGALFTGVQRKFAWVARSMFVASYVSADCDYFAAELQRNLPFVTARATNPIGAYDTSHAYSRIAVKDGGQTATAPWMQYYLATVMDAVARKLPQWRPFAQFLGKFMVNWCAHPYTAFAAIGSFDVLNTEADGKTQTQMNDFSEQLRRSLVNRFNWPADQAQALIDARSVDEVFAIAQAMSAAGSEAGIPAAGKCVAGVCDWANAYVASPDAYGAMAQAAMYCAYNAGTPGAIACKAWADKVPTPVQNAANWIFNFTARQPQP